MKLISLASLLTHLLFFFLFYVLPSASTAKYLNVYHRISSESKNRHEYLKPNQLLFPTSAKASLKKPHSSAKFLEKIRGGGEVPIRDEANYKESIVTNNSMGVSRKGLEMDMDISVNAVREKLERYKDGKLKPLYIILQFIQSVLFYGAPTIATASFINSVYAGIKNRRHDSSKETKNIGGLFLEQNNNKKIEKSENVSNLSGVNFIVQKVLQIFKLFFFGHDPRFHHKNIFSGSKISKNENQMMGVCRRSVSPSYQYYRCFSNSSKQEFRVDYGKLISFIARFMGQFATIIAIGLLSGQFILRESVGGGIFASAKYRDQADILLAILIAFQSSKASGLLSFTPDMYWYSMKIKKPKWTPPNFIFPLVWTPLKFFQALATVMVWREMRRDALRIPMLAFFLQACLGDLWNYVFFQNKYIGAGVVVILSLLASVFYTIYEYYHAYEPAGLLLIPTAVWLIVASALNIHIWVLNGKEALYPYQRKDSYRQNPRRYFS